MKFTRGKRIAFELLGPAALGAGICCLVYLCAATWGILVEKRESWNALYELGSMMPMIFLFAYVSAGLQSILYTAIMEWRFKQGLNPRSWRMVGWSTLVGFASGGVFTLGELGNFEAVLPSLATLGGFGLVVGFLMGLLIRRWSKEPISNGDNSP